MGTVEHAHGAGDALRFEHVVRRYGSRAALDGLDLGVALGETVALLGPNGAGKTTAISLVLGLLRPDEGTVTVLGSDPRLAMARGRVAATLQQSGTGLPPGVRVDRALRMVAALYPQPLDVGEVAGLAGIVPLLGRRTHQLSGGQAQQVRFAMAIVGDPELLFLDEPTSAMDVHARQRFWHMVRRFGRQDRTVVFATHHLDEADNADRVVVLHHGRVVADGPGATLKAAAATRQLRFVCAAPDLRLLDQLAGATDVTLSGTAVVIDSLDADATVRDLVRSGMAFRHLEVRAARLEEAFLALTRAPRPTDGPPADAPAARRVERSATGEPGDPGQGRVGERQVPGRRPPDDDRAAG
jgi:ABC-2 type transport system ATP-binding protein